MERIAGQKDEATGRIRPHLVTVEPVTEADIENTGHDGVDSIFRVSVWHELHAIRHPYSYHVRARLGGLTDDDGKADRWRKRRERPPIDVFGQDRFKLSLPWLVSSNRCTAPMISAGGLHFVDQCLPSQL
jgi:hypothetical protein